MLVIARWILHVALLLVSMRLLNGNILREQKKKKKHNTV